MTHGPRAVTGTALQSETEQKVGQILKIFRVYVQRTWGGVGGGEKKPDVIYHGQTFEQENTVNLMCKQDFSV